MLEKLSFVVLQIKKTNNSCLYLFQVVPYGSVPLKTYLPDGDIDLTILSGILSDGLAKDVISALEAETLNENAEFVIKDVQYICAEVSVSFHFIDVMMCDLCMLPVVYSMICFLVSRLGL